MSKVDEIDLLHKASDEVRFILQRVMKKYSDACYENDNLHRAVVTLQAAWRDDNISADEFGVMLNDLCRELEG